MKNRKIGFCGEFLKITNVCKYIPYFLSFAITVDILLCYLDF